MSLPHESKEIISKGGIVAANNISAATNQFGSPLQRTWDDRAALPRRAGMKPGNKKGKAVQLARIVIQMATSKELPRLTGLRFGR
jgi:hypothetical protein